MVIFVQQTRRLRFQIFIQLSLQATRMPCDFTLAIVFATSTSGRFVRLKPIKFSYNFQVYNRTEFNKTIIPFALVGYEMVIANSALRASLAIYHLISNARS